MSAKSTREALNIAGIEIAPGERKRIDIPFGKRASGNEISLPVEVIHGLEPGARLFVSAAVHGDEIAGVEIIRRVLGQRSLRRLRGTLIAVPIVNLHGFVALSRYLPDRRDLNRSFPGSARGSLAGRLADLFLREIVANATHGIDLHTAAVHRSNLPQVRACIDDPETAELAHAFGVPVIINSNLRDGSLRQTVFERDIPILLYEGGEALRFEEAAIRAGARGVIRVMRALKMIKGRAKDAATREPYIARSSYWERAPESGILRSPAALGRAVKAGDLLGIVADPLGNDRHRVVASKEGIIIGRTELPLVNEGDALFHLASFDAPGLVAADVEDFQGELDTLHAEPFET